MPTSPPSSDFDRVRYPRLASALASLFLVLAVVRIWAGFTENLNWDEFALLQRAVLSARTGEVVGGGRPGLGTVLLIPFAAECRNAVEALAQARLMWTVMVLTSAATFWLLLRRVLPASPHRWLAATTGLGLWVLAPPFLRFSTQVRTDQPAVLFGLLGGLALLTSRERVAWAAPAGVLFGAGFLFSQKLVYVAGLMAVLAAGQLLLQDDWRPRREIARAGLASLVFVVTVAGYRELIGGSATLVPLSGGLTTFEHYRAFVGWRFYRSMVPLLVPQLTAIALLALLSLGWRWLGRRPRQEVLIGWAVLAAGVAVTLFHAGRFPYFYLVLGLFPGTVGALVASAALRLLKTPVSRLATISALWVPLVILAVMQSSLLLNDTQRHQWASLAFVERNFSPATRGFHTRAAFACRQDPDPVRVRFVEHIRRDFGPEDSRQATGDLLAGIRERQTAFMIPPLPGEPYPPEVWDFLRTRFVHYYGAIHVAGREIHGAAGWAGEFEVIAPGRYRWRPASQDEVPLEVDGVTLERGETVALSVQETVSIRLPEGGAGMLVLDLQEEPAPGDAPFFLGF